MTRVNKKTIPFVGRIAADGPIVPVPESEQLNFFNRFDDNRLYQLEIRDNSMSNVGITEGDIVLIEPARSAFNGQIIVALIDQTDTSLKRFYQRGKKIELYSENKKFQPQLYQSDRVEIQGILHSIHKFSL